MGVKGPNPLFDPYGGLGGVLARFRARADRIGCDVGEWPALINGVDDEVAVVKTLKRNTHVALESEFANR